MAKNPYRIHGLGVLKGYASDSAYLSAMGTTPLRGDIYFNTTTNIFKYYDGSNWLELPQRRNRAIAKLLDDSTTTTPTGHQTVDGTLTVDGDKVLMTAHSTTAGIYIAGTGLWELALDLSGTDGVPVDGDQVWVSDGSVYASSEWTFNGSAWTQQGVTTGTATNSTLRWSGTAWVENDEIQTNLNSIFGKDDVVNDANPAIALNVTAASKTAGTGDGGNLVLSGGGSFGGNQGDVVLNGYKVLLDAQHSSDPTGVNAGELYYNTTDNQFKYYNGLNWLDIGGGMEIGNPVASGTAGSVLFIDGSGNLAQDNSAFSWNIANKYLSSSATVNGSGTSTADYSVYAHRVSTAAASGVTGVVGSAEKTTNGGGNVNGLYGVATATITTSIHGVRAKVINNASSSTGRAVFIETPTNTSSFSDYYGLFIQGASGGTVSGVNRALHVDSGESYFGANVTLNGHILLGADVTYDLGNATNSWRYLYAQTLRNAAGNNVILLNARELYDGSNVSALSWGDRTLRDAAGAVAVTWNDGSGNFKLHDNITANTSSTYNIGEPTVRFATGYLGTVNVNGSFQIQQATNSVSIAAPSLGSTYTLNLPANQGGANTYLKNDGSGNLSWDTPAGGAGITVVTPGAYPYNASNGNWIKVDTSSARTINLPAPSANTRIVVKDAVGSASANNITIARSGSENIEGLAADYLVQADWDTVILVSDGTDWFIE